MKTNRGKVYLVGGGPGDPGLLTLRGAECLRQADVVLYDGLVNPLLLRHTKATTERTCRSDGPQGRTLIQAEINNQLIAEAKQGKIVVRLKGGDPFIFGRGSEEAAALAEAGIPFEVIPGITAATAAGAYTGISLTHREFASAVAFITGHEDPAKAQSSLDYNQLAKFPGTLVFYMGLHRLETIIESLVQSGLNETTPGCVISRASTPSQKTISAPLNLLAEQVRSHDLHAPSLIIIGDCVRQRENIAWFEQRPLLGKRIGITRPIEQAGDTIEHCMSLGAEPVLLPMIEILPPDHWTKVDAAIQKMAENQYDWLIFTSANGVHYLMQRIWETGKDLRLLASIHIAVIGPATSAALEEYHLRAEIMPEQFQSEGLANALADHVSGKNILWAGANRGRGILQEKLTSDGANVDKIIVYHNKDVSFPTNSHQENDLDWIGLSSPSIARRYAEMVKMQQPSTDQSALPRLAAMSQITANTASKAGLQIEVIAETHTWASLLKGIIEAENSQNQM